jgi:hypothetical protein
MSNTPQKPIPYQVKTNGSINLFVNGSIKTIGPDDLNYKVVLQALKREDWNKVLGSLSVKGAIADHTDGRVEVFGEEIHIDKKPLPSAISKRVIPLLRKADFNLKPLFRLLENIEANPAEFSRNELYLFLEANDLPFTADGHFLAYKMVSEDYKDLHSRKIDNSVGNVVEMPREEVNQDRAKTCSVGLHFCAFSYLPAAYYTNNDSNRLMVVKINPADVVSIPNDYDNAKGRCWRYEVVDELAHFEDSLPVGYTDTYADHIDDTAEDDEPEVLDDDEDVLITPKKATVSATPTKAKGDYSAKLDAAKVRKIRKLLAEGDWTLVGIAEVIGCSARQVARVRDGEVWTDIK